MSIPEIKWRKNANADRFQASNSCTEIIALCLLLFVIGGLTILLLVTPMWTKCKVNIQTKLTAVPPWRPSLAYQENQ